MLARSDPRRYTAIMVAVMVVLLVGVISLRPASTIEGVRVFDVRSSEHTLDNVNYQQTPPVGGPHSPRVHPCGVFEDPVSDELAVHAMERGVVWITHPPSLSETHRRSLAALAKGKPVIVSPFPGLTRPVVVSTWGAQLPLGSVSDARLERFVEIYAGSATAPKAGEGCP